MNSIERRPRISISDSRAMYVGPGLDLAPHRNAVAVVAIALHRPFTLHFPADASSVPADHLIALIPPNTLHHIGAAGLTAFIYLDALSDDYQHLRKMNLSQARSLLLETDYGNLGTVDQVCTAMGVPPRARPDSRLATILERMNQRPQAFGRVRDAARIAQLSTSHFQALFSQSIGVPFRRYRLWRRMAVALIVVSEGGTLTEAAFNAGFSSSSHLSTAFRGMFGLTPSRLVKLDLQLDIDPLIGSHVAF